MQVIFAMKFNFFSKLTYYVKRIWHYHQEKLLIYVNEEIKHNTGAKNSLIMNRFIIIVKIL